MGRAPQKPPVRAPRLLASGRAASGHLLPSRRPRWGPLSRTGRSRVLCWLAVALAALALLSYSGGPLRRRGAHSSPDPVGAVAATTQCVGWRHTLSCSPYG